MYLAVWTPQHSQAVLAGGNVLLSGAPGAGKSYLIREVILPALLAQGAQVLVVDYADVYGAKIKSATGAPLRRLVLGAETFGPAAANAPSPAPGLLASSCLVTLDGPRVARDGMCDLLLQSLYAELLQRPRPPGTPQYLIIDISHLTPAIPTFKLMLRNAAKFGFTLIVTCQSPSTLDDDLLALFRTHLAFYHFFKRCLRCMAQAVLTTSTPALSGLQTQPSDGLQAQRAAPLNMFGQPVATPTSQLAGVIAKLKVGECLLATPGIKFEKLKANPWA